MAGTTRGAFGVRYSLGGVGRAPKAPAPPKPPAPAGSTATPSPPASELASEAAGFGNAYAQLNPGWAPTVSPAGVTVTPHPASAPTPPYMTGQNIVDYGNAFKSHEDQIAAANSQLDDVKAQAQTALYNIGRNYLQGTDNAQNDAAARGIFQSSIKDGSLADLAATNAAMTGDITTRLNNAQLFHDTALANINNWFNNFQDGMNTIKVENAAAIPGAPAAPTTFTPTPAAAAPAPASTAPNATGGAAQPATGPVFNWGARPTAFNG